MNNTDPIADMLTRIRNAIMVNKKDVTIPLSTEKLEVSKILKSEGYISNFKVDNSELFAQIVVELKYNDKKNGVIEGLKRVSKPGRRVYTKSDNVPKVLGGLGVAIISTSKGIMTGRECKKNNVGGEVLLHVW